MRTSRARTAVLVGCALLGLLPAACASSVPGQPENPTTTATGPTPGPDGLLIGTVVRMSAGPDADAGTAVSTMGSRLFQQTRAPGDNSVVSPYSVYVALAMTEAGAAGDTAAQLKTYLGAADAAGSVTAIDAAVADAVAASAKDLEDTDQAAVVESANTLWGQRGLEVKQPYLDALSAGFGAGMYVTDFTGDTQGSRDRINDWVSGRTRELIPELLAQDDLTPDTLVVLVNALYLSAQWDDSFTSEPNGDFHAVDGTVAQVPMMSGSAHYGYATGPDWEAVSIPYRGDGLAMTLIVPAEGKFEKVAGSVDAAMLAAAVDGDTSGEINLTMPPFSAGSRSELSAPLIESGVSDLFDSSKVDLSGVAGKPGDLVVSKVIHQTIVEVDENGTTAAAATAVVQEAGSAPNQDPPKDLVVDRPFLFVIHDTATNAPLFLGQVVDPTA